MKRDIFFIHIKESLFKNYMTNLQIEGINNILDEWEKRKLTNLWWLAYMLATVYHETDKEMQPIREKGSEKYLESKPYYPYVGAGLVQVTWLENYLKFGAKHPNDLLHWPECLLPLFDGMIQGMFTGKKLGDFFHHIPHDGPSARTIINGMDKAYLIWGYALIFHNALVASL